MRVNTYLNRKGERKFQVVLDETEVPAFAAGDLNAAIAEGLAAHVKPKRKGNKGE